jgi:hypothetical protein
MINNWWEDDLFVSFLHWMIDKKGWAYSAHEIVYVVEKPWKYETSWDEFKKEIINAD